MNLSSLFYAAVGAAWTFLICVLITTQYLAPRYRAEGASQERAAAYAAAIKLTEQRNKLNEEIKALSKPELCARLGGRWVSNTASCE